MMTHQEYRDALDRLGLNQVEASRVLGFSARNSRYYAALNTDEPPIPRVVEVALTLMIENAKLKKKLEKTNGRNNR